MAACSLGGALFGLPLLAWPVFVSGILAALVDLDTTGGGHGRTPFGHSVPAAMLWGCLACACAAAVSPGCATGMAIAAAVAFGSHLSLDALTGGGIFLWPRNWEMQDWLSPFPPGRILRLDGQEFLALDEDQNERALAWEGWRSLTAGGLPGRAPKDRSARLNIALAAASLAGVLAAVVLSK
jgi:hypothetical protein